MSKNFGESWEGMIERIRENLRDGRYALKDGIFPIVKELIQNAEDSKASRLMIVWEPGLSDALHPLLQGPGLIAINDGAFDNANARAIREMGLSSKAADASTIGKFGLGMKSVFHLGEVFFFVAVDASGMQLDADVRSPWSTDNEGLHPEWDQFEAVDHAAIIKRVQSLFGNGRWFCLWVPLRTIANCNEIDPIESYFPGDEPASKMIGAVQFEQTAAILPLLAHLQSIQFRVCTADHVVSHDIEVSDGSSRRLPLDEDRSDGHGTESIFHGEITSNGTTSKNVVRFSGMERRLSDNELSILEKDDIKKWPKRFATNKTTGRSEQVSEKANQHAAVCFTAVRNANGNAQLKIHWAVFLPLGHAEPIEIGPAGWNVDLVLHGWFFPNSGRTEVEGLLSRDAPLVKNVSDSSAVRLAWNHRLARYGTLPLSPTFAASRPMALFSISVSKPKMSRNCV